MGYDYQTERSNLFTEDGVKALRVVEQEARRLCAVAGSARADKMWRVLSGDSWRMLACVDYLVEDGVLREITGPEVWGQHRVFVLANETSR